MQCSHNILQNYKMVFQTDIVNIITKFSYYLFDYDLTAVKPINCEPMLSLDQLLVRF